MNKDNLVDALSHINTRTRRQVRADAIAALSSTSPAELLLMPGWGSLVDWLQDDDFKAAIAAQDIKLGKIAWLTNNAFDTPPWVCKELFERYLFPAGLENCKRLLFPACGTGIFAAALQAYWPEFYASVEITAIDTDPFRCRIFQELNPRATVINTDFLSWAKQQPPDRYCAAIDNVPFSGTKVDGFPVHTAFALEMTRLVRPQGAIALIISTGFLSSPGNQPARQDLKAKATLKYVAHLPQGVFHKSGTDTGADFLLLIKGEKQ